MPRLLPGVELPTKNFPSFKWLDIEEVTYDSKYVNRVSFQRVLIKIPSCKEEYSSEDLEDYVYNVAK